MTPTSGNHAININRTSLPCQLSFPRAYVLPDSKFVTYGNKHGIPPMFLAAFAMQESTCNAYISKGGLMQITSDKWYGAPNGNPQDPDFNIDRGAEYFAGVLNGDAGGNVVRAVGEYNGWQLKMTKSQVLSRSSCQQNLD